MNFGLRLVAKIAILIAGFAAMGALQEYLWPLGFVGAIVTALIAAAVLVNLIPFDQSDGMHIWRYFRRFIARWPPVVIVNSVRL